MCVCRDGEVRAGREGSRVYLRVRELLVCFCQGSRGVRLAGEEQKTERDRGSERVKYARQAGLGSTHCAGRVTDGLGDWSRSVDCVEEELKN